MLIRNPHRIRKHRKADKMLNIIFVLLMKVLLEPKQNIWVQSFHYKSNPTQYQYKWITFDLLQLLCGRQCQTEDLTSIKSSLLLCRSWSRSTLSTWGSPTKQIKQITSFEASASSLLKKKKKSSNDMSHIETKEPSHPRACLLNSLTATALLKTKHCDGMSTHCPACKAINPVHIPCGYADHICML